LRAEGILPSVVSASVVSFSFSETEAAAEEEEVAGKSNGPLLGMPTRRKGKMPSPRRMTRMSKIKPQSGSRRNLLDEIERLAEKVRSFQSGVAEKSPPADGAQNAAQADGLAEGIVAALGRMVPDLGKLIETASGSSDFRQRLAGIDEEVRRKFKDQPLHRASAGLASGASRRQMGIPPSIRRSGGGRAHTAGAGPAQSSGKAAPRGKYPSPRPPKVHLSSETPAQLPVDVFDEGKRIVILAEAPGLTEADIAVALEGTVLVITIEAAHRRGVQRIELPCEVAGRPAVSLANGVLNIQVRKKATQP
jgi:hypothetical protein